MLMHAGMFAARGHLEASGVQCDDRVEFDGPPDEVSRSARSPAVRYVLNACFFIASGIIARFTISGKVVSWGESLAFSAILWAMTQIFFIAFVQIYDLVTVGVDEQEELLKDNLAVGVSVGMSVVACAVQLSSPIEKSESIVAVCIWFCLSVIFLMIFKLLARLFLAPNALVEVDGRPSDAGVSTVEGATLLFVSLGLRSVITYRGCTPDARPWTDRIIDIPWALSIFTYYNIAFPFVIFGYLIVLRGVFSVPHIVRRIRKGEGIVEAVQSFLDITPDAYTDTTELAVRTDSSRVVGANEAVPPRNANPPPTSPSAAVAVSNDATNPTGATNIAGRWYSPARAIAFSGFIIGGGFVIRGAFGATVNSTADPQNTIGFFVLWLLFGTALMVLNNLLVTFALWRRIAHKYDHVGGALIEATAFITSGLNVGSALLSLQGSESHTPGQEFDWGSDLAVILIYAFVQQILMVMFGAVYQIITPYDDVEEVQKGNLAAAVSSSLSWIAFGIITSAPIQRNDAAALFFCFCILAYVYVLLHRLFVDKVILIGAPLEEEIVRDQNYGAASIEGACAIGVAMALCSLIRPPC